MGNVDELLSELPKKTLIGLMRVLVKDIIRWQEQHNKNATNIENLTGKKQLRVLIESEEEMLLSLFSFINDYN
jgi:hypothetical protein